MARNIKKLPKWAIKQAGGINKKAWALARRGRGAKRQKGRVKRQRKAVRRRAMSRARSTPRSRGIVAKLNAGLKGLRLGLPAIGVAMTAGINKDFPKLALNRYSGFDLDTKEFNTDTAVNAGAFYAGNVIEAKAMSLMKIPQMAGRKKLLSIAANFLPEISALPDAMAGNFGEAVNELGRNSIGYQATDNQSFMNPTVRDQWLKALGGRLILGAFSRFVGPMVNKHLPKGVNI